MKITYLCDREKCERCSYPTCERTSDIMHAKNFMVFHDCDGEILGATEIDPNEPNPFEPIGEMPEFAKKKLNI